MYRKLLIKTLQQNRKDVKLTIKPVTLRKALLHNAYSNILNQVTGYKYNMCAIEVVAREVYVNGESTDEFVDAAEYARLDVKIKREINYDYLITRLKG